MYFIAFLLGYIFYHYFITLRQTLWHIISKQYNYFCANVAVFQWTMAFCNKGNLRIQEKL